MIVEKGVIKYNSRTEKEEKTYKCKSKILGLTLKKLLKNDSNIRIIKMRFKKNSNGILYDFIVHYWSYADRIQAEKLLREKYIFIDLGYGKMITSK